MALGHPWMRKRIPASLPSSQRLLLSDCLVLISLMSLLVFSWMNRKIVPFMWHRLRRHVHVPPIISLVTMNNRTITFVYFLIVHVSNQMRISFLFVCFCAIWIIPVIMRCFSLIVHRWHQRQPYLLMMIIPRLSVIQRRPRLREWLCHRIHGRFIISSNQSSS